MFETGRETMRLLTLWNTAEISLLTAVGENEGIRKQPAWVFFFPFSFPQVIPCSLVRDAEGREGPTPAFPETGFFLTSEPV